jgi:hypothetical protein
MLECRAYNPRVLDAQQLPNNIDQLKALVLEQHLRVQSTAVGN